MQIWLCFAKNSCMCYPRAAGHIVLVLQSLHSLQEPGHGVAITLALRTRRGGWLALVGLCDSMKLHWLYVREPIRQHSFQVSPLPCTARQQQREARIAQLADQHAAWQCLHIMEQLWLLCKVSNLTSCC